MTDELYLPDQGDGSYRNPVLCCDYSDPDVIRVGDTYYMTASSFNYVPGLPILTSADLVNWRLVNYAPPPRVRRVGARHPLARWIFLHLLRDAGRGHLHGARGGCLRAVGRAEARAGGQRAD